MSRSDELPPDQRAALSVLLRQRKSYAEVAAMLGIPSQAVHDRAHAALVVLAPAQARGLTPAEREEVGDYMLGQLGPAERSKARETLGSSVPARAWAEALVQELAPLAGPDLPEIPEPAPALPPAPEPVPSPRAAGIPGKVSATAGGEAAPETAGGEAAPEAGPEPSSSSLPSSRVGGAVLLAVVLAAVIVAAVLLLSGGSGHSHSSSTTAAKAGGPKADARIVMRPPGGHGSSVGLVEILSEGSRRAFYIVAANLPPSHGFFYALWLYNSPTSNRPLSRAPAVGASGRLEGGSLLPSDAGQFKQLLLTRETSTAPTHPGPVVLQGQFTLGS